MRSEFRVDTVLPGPYSLGRVHRCSASTLTVGRLAPHISMMVRMVTALDVIGPLMDTIGRLARGPGSVYLVGGASAVWFGWRVSTVDVDIALAPEPPGLFGAIEQLKRNLGINREINRYPSLNAAALLSRVRSWNYGSEDA